MERKIKYSNKDITVVWQPDLCCHASICHTELPEVFNPKIKKWINTEGATTDRIIEQVNRCPSGALSFYYNEKKL